MERNKRTARTLTAALCLALLAGCGAETAGESLDADEMHPGWSTVTTDPSAYGITYQELEDLSGMPLDQLTAYCLGADGVYGENGFDQLYHRFLEAPDTVLSYLALIDSREERELLCTHLASADVSWYGGTEAFGAILDRLAGESGTSGGAGGADPDRVEIFAINRNSCAPSRKEGAQPFLDKGLWASMSHRQRDGGTACWGAAAGMGFVPA